MTSIADNAKKRRRGRPRTGIGKPVGLRLYPELERRIDAWASEQSDNPGRPEAIRRLIELALVAPKKYIPNVSISQVKAARALLTWSQEELATAADLSIPTIKRLEAHDGALGGR